MAKGDLEALVGALHPDTAALRAAVDKLGGYVVEITHFELRAITPAGRRVCYRLAEGETGIEVAGRLYE